MADDLNPWSDEHWNVTEQARYIKDKGIERAQARARDAGTTVGAPRKRKPVETKRPLQIFQKHITQILGSGGGGSSNSYDHTQSSAAATWTIAHNLGRNPIVQTRTVGGVEMEGQITHLSVNVVQLDFNDAVAGTARLV